VKTLAFIAVALLSSATCVTAAEPASQPAAYGREDTLGAVNNLSAQTVLQAAGLIRHGKVYSLAIPTSPRSVAYGPRNYQIHVAPIFVGNDSTYGANRLQGFDDVIISHLGVGTQIDGFAHVAINGRHYNGVKTQDVIRPGGTIRYGVETIPPIVGRGVLLDMAAAAAPGGLAAGTVFNRRELEAAAEREGVRLRKGDIVLLHTGHLVAADNDYQQDLQHVAGLGVEGADYLAGLGVVAVGMDAWIPEAMPAEHKEDFLPVHGTLLVKHGVHILENIRTAELAADRAYEFFFVLAAPRFAGAVQSVVHPVAIR
jgi:kynurenine formamidase